MIKQFSLQAIAACVFCVLAVSCAKEQSSLNPDDASGRATITGTLTYSQGQEYSSSKGFTEKIVPAAGVEVFVDVNNDCFKPGFDPDNIDNPYSTTSGFTTYSAVTDQNGKYSISVPAVPTGVIVIVRANDFVATASEVVGQKDGKPVFKTGEAIYHMYTTEEFLTPGNIIDYSEQFDYYFKDQPAEFTTTGDIRVDVRFNAYKTSNQKIFTIPSDEVDLLVKVTYNEPYYLTRTYGVSTDRNGTAELEVPLFEENCTVSLEIEAFRLKGDFTDKSTGSNKNMEGYYAQYDFNRNGFVSLISSATFDGLEGVVSYHKVPMLFVPFAGEDPDGLLEEPYAWRSAYNYNWE